MNDHQPTTSPGRRIDPLLLASVSIVWWADRSGRIAERQPHWEKFTGQAWQAYRGEGWLSAFHEEDRAAVEAEWRRGIGSGGALLVRGRLWSEERGAWRSVQLRAIPARNDDGLAEWQASAIELDEASTAGNCVDTASGDLAVSIEALRRSEERARLLLREVNHRSKNLLSVVMTIARHTSDGNSADFLDRFDSRIRSLSINQDMMIRNDWSGVDLRELLVAHLEPFAEARDGRVVLDGAPLHVTSALACQSLGMAVHELAMNASRYGALSRPQGRVDFGWEVLGSADRPRLSMRWRETGGPPVEPPLRKGFGTIVLTSMLQYSLGAEIELSYLPGGLQWAIRCPLGRVVQGTRPPVVDQVRTT